MTSRRLLFVSQPTALEITARNLSVPVIHSQVMTSRRLFFVSQPTALEITARNLPVTVVPSQLNTLWFISPITDTRDT